MWESVGSFTGVEKSEAVVAAQSSEPIVAPFLLLLSIEYPVREDRCKIGRNGWSLQLLVKMDHVIFTHLVPEAVAFRGTSELENLQQLI